MQKLVFATNNEHKLSEVKEMLQGLFEVVSLKQVEIFDDIPEDADTLEGNARIKARHIHNITGLNVFADDTGLEIDYLNGEPGVYSARYAGIDKDAEGNMNLVLSKMRGILNRKAQFRTSIALILNDKEYLFEGKVEGKMLTNKSGDKGFGYDPIFKPNGFNCSFAEMSSIDKNKISHRGRAVQKLIEFLKVQSE
jgi:XTP/dITP diphosphohydrolase